MSAIFLLLIAGVNLAILLSIRRTFRRVRSGEKMADDQLDVMLSGGGLMAGILRPMFALIGQSWHMYPLGFLFGLGFDTATEIGVLGISASSASTGLPIASILVFPALFTAGMALMDTLDSILMAGTYGWAFGRPIRKLYYNMTISFVSVIVAVGVGGIEALGLLADREADSAHIIVGSLNDNMGAVGLAIVDVFIASWAVSVVIYRMRGYDRLDA